MNQEIIVYCDGGSRGNPGDAAAAFIVNDSYGKTIIKQGKFINKQTNNVAEYTAVLEALKWLSKNEYLKNKIIFYLDSQLVVNQLNGIYKVREKTLFAFTLEIKRLEKLFVNGINFNYIPREKNKDADLLVNETLNIGRVKSISSLLKTSS